MTKRKIQFSFESLAQQKRQAMEIVQPRIPKIHHIRRLLTHTNDAFPVDLSTWEVVGGHLGDRMTNAIVYGASGNLSTRDMRQRNAGNHGSACRSENFKSIPCNNNDIGAQVIERVGKTDHSQAHGFSHAHGYRSTAAFPHGH